MHIQSKIWKTKCYTTTKRLKVKCFERPSSNRWTLFLSRSTIPKAWKYLSVDELPKRSLRKDVPSISTIPRKSRFFCVKIAHLSSALKRESRNLSKADLEYHPSKNIFFVCKQQRTLITPSIPPPHSSPPYKQIYHLSKNIVFVGNKQRKLITSSHIIHITTPSWNGFWCKSKKTQKDAFGFPAVGTNIAIQPLCALVHPSDWIFPTDMSAAANETFKNNISVCWNGWNLKKPFRCNNIFSLLFHQFISVIVNFYVQVFCKVFLPCMSLLTLQRKWEAQQGIYSWFVLSFVWHSSCAEKITKSGVMEFHFFVGFRFTEGEP